MNDGSAPWIKIITRIFEDPKIIAIEQLPEGNGVLVIWFKLMCLAGEQNRGGSIYFTETVPFTAELLATKWRCKPALVQMALVAFQRFGMIGIDKEGTIFISNWSKYQNMEGLARIRDRSLLQIENRSGEKSEHSKQLAAERQRRHRQKHKMPGENGTVTRNALRCVTVTPTGKGKESIPQGAVTPQNKKEIESKNKIPPSVPQGGTNADALDSDEARETKQWLSELFGRKRDWSDDENALLLRLLPISPEDRELIRWGYSLSRDAEGWALVYGDRATKPKQSLIVLLREFGSELDKWRSVRKQGEESERLSDRESQRDEWPAGAKEAAIQLYGEGVTLPDRYSQLSGSVQSEIEALLSDKSAKKSAA